MVDPEKFNSLGDQLPQKYRLDATEQAPLWMQEVGFEWLWRLGTELNWRRKPAENESHQSNNLST